MQCLIITEPFRKAVMTLSSWERGISNYLTETIISYFNDKYGNVRGLNSYLGSEDKLFARFKMGDSYFALMKILNLLDKEEGFPNSCTKVFKSFLVNKCNIECIL